MIIKNALLQNGISDLKIENGKIIEIGKFSEKGDIDALGKRVIPGLIDVHIHGFSGVDFSDDDFYKIDEALVKSGTTSYLATLMTGSVEETEKLTKRGIPELKGNMLGYHLEGPYISEKKSGAQNKAYIKNPDIEEFYRFKNVRKITIAPELIGAIDFIKTTDISVSIGHTDCDYDTAILAIEAGANSLTHTFNAMPPILHRAPGPIGAAAEKGIYAEIICDGIHVEKAAFLAAYKMFGSEKLILISDAIRPAGSPDGKYDSGGLLVVMQDSIARLTDGTLAGGSGSLLCGVKKAVEFGVDFYEAVKMASETPAKSLGLKKGVIKEGYDADLVILDDDMTVLKTIVSGNVVYSL